MLTGLVWLMPISPVRPGHRSVLKGQLRRSNLFAPPTRRSSQPASLAAEQRVGGGNCNTGGLYPSDSVFIERDDLSLFFLGQLESSSLLMLATTSGAGQQLTPGFASCTLSAAGRTSLVL